MLPVSQQVCSNIDYKYSLYQVFSFNIEVVLIL